MATSDPLPPPGFATYVACSEVLGAAPSLDEIADTLRRCRTEDCIRIVSALNLSLDTHGVGNRPLQESWTRVLFDPDLASKIIRLSRRARHRVIFFEQQLLNAAKLILLHCPEEGGAALHENEDILHAFSRDCLLGITDHIDSVEDRRALLSPSSEEERRRLRVKARSRNLLFNARDQYRYLLPRYHDLFFIVPADTSSGDAESELSVPDLFHQATGLDLLRYFGLAFGLIANYIGLDFSRPREVQPKLYLHPATYFQKTLAEPDEIEAILKRLSVTQSQFQQEFAEELDLTGDLFWSFITLRNRPMFRTPDARYLPISLRFLQEKATSGVFWDINDFLREPERTRFRSLFGILFQTYVGHIIKRMFAGTPAARPEILLAHRYQTRAGEREASDAAVVEDRNVLFVEASVTRLKMVETAVRGDIDKFEEDLGNIVIENAQQADRVVRDFREGLFTVGDRTYEDVKTILPVIVTIEPVPLFPPAIQHVDAQLAERNILRDPKVAPLQLITAEELEMLEGWTSSGGRLWDLLRERAETPYYRFMPMKSFLFDRVFLAGEPENPHLGARFEDITNRVARFLFGPTSASPP